MFGHFLIIFIDEHPAICIFVICHLLIHEKEVSGLSFSLSGSDLILITVSIVVAVNLKYFINWNSIHEMFCAYTKSLFCCNFFSSPRRMKDPKRMNEKFIFRPNFDGIFYFIFFLVRCRRCCYSFAYNFSFSSNKYEMKFILLYFFSLWPAE